MIDAGYFAKHIVTRPEWLEAAGVDEICSVSHCVSRDPDGWIGRWQHNGFGWFDRPADALAAVSSGERDRFRLFAYRIHPQVFRGSGQSALVVPHDVRPEPITGEFASLGFDSASKSMESIVGFECSPLSCNSMAVELRVNRHCLFASFDEAVAGAQRFAAEQPEPGDYHVIEVLERRC